MVAGLFGLRKGARLLLDAFGSSSSVASLLRCTSRRYRYGLVFMLAKVPAVEA